MSACQYIQQHALSCQRTLRMNAMCWYPVCACGPPMAFAKGIHAHTHIIARMCICAWPAEHPADMASLPRAFIYVYVYLHTHTHADTHAYLHKQLLETCFFEWSHAASMGRLRRAFEQLATVGDAETYMRVYMRVVCV
jgi:hypothetical protein